MQNNTQLNINKDRFLDLINDAEAKGYKTAIYAITQKFEPNDAHTASWFAEWLMTNMDEFINPAQEQTWNS